ncbi:MAG TPA: lysophospholipid acyltransferase family protein [Candidatus Margulisiibacteriota bacterium]|nr:lysophospholipid acyltransferase family protein [Candidatus Margulisiibacteriota bacterium]
MEQTVDKPGRLENPAVAAVQPRRRHPWRDRFLRLIDPIIPRLISGTLWLIAKTVRIEYVNADDLFARWARGEQMILAFWHNRVVMMPIAYQGRGRKLCIMNSQHRDGEIATRALERWGIRSVRGSATRGGAAGFLQLVNAFRDGYDLAVVPDGPRGPRYVVKRGVIHLGKATGAPIIPVTYAAARRRQLHNWDRFIIPLPFSRIVYVVGEPLRVPRDIGEEEAEVLRLELEGRLNTITAVADARVARSRDDQRP